MPLDECLVFPGAAEQGQPFVPGDTVTGFRLVQVGGEVTEFQFLGLFGKGRADGHEIGRVFHADHFFRIHLQGFHEAFFQFGQKVQGPAQESHVAGDFPALGQIADGLVHHRLEDGLGDVLLGSAVVHQGLDVRFGEHAAAGGDGIDAFRVGRQVVKTFGVRVQKGRHVVDEGAGAPGADAIHPFLRRRTEIHDLGIFPAQFYHGIRLGNQFFHGCGRRDDFLYERQLQPLGDTHARRTRKGEAEARRPDHLFQRSQVCN